MKRSAGKMFIRIFIRSFFIVGVLFLAGVLSYKAAMLYWKPADKQAEVAYQDDVYSEGAVNAETDGISKNLIYCYDKETDEITKLVLEVFDLGNHKLTYISIPVKTKLTVSNALYQRLILDAPELPQVLKLSTIMEYLDSDKAYEDELLIVEELLGTKINYYTTVPKETYDTMFKDKYIEQSDQYDAVPMEIYTGDYKKLLKTLDSKEKRKAYIEELYPELQSNLSVEDKLDLLDSYSKISQNDVTFELIPGHNLNSGYVIDKDAARQQLQELTGIN